MKGLKGLAILLVAGVVLWVATYIIQYRWAPPQNTPTSYRLNGSYGQFYGPGMMRGFRGRGMMGGYGYGGMMGGFQNYYSNQSVDDNSANKEMDESLKDAVINKQENSITFSGNNIKIVMFGGPENADEKFVIGGLVNPTIYVKEGTSINLELINKDEGMPHGIEITEAAPPYYYMTMMQGGIYPGSYVPVIPQAKNGRYPVANTNFKANYKGEYYYICQYPGHAQNGMYGKIIVQ